jgi:DNA-binding MarR family transcriptional regulator
MRRQLDSALNRRLASESGLSSADYELLVPLSEASGQQLRACDLARAVDWEKSRLSHHINRMRARGLISREDCPTDARGAVIRLTEQGRHAIEAAAPDHVESVRRYFLDLLSPEEIDTLASIANRVLNHLTDRAPQNLPTTRLRALPNDA